MNLKMIRVSHGLTQPVMVGRLKEIDKRVDVPLYSKMEAGLCLPTPPMMNVVLNALGEDLSAVYTADEIHFPENSAEPVAAPEVFPQKIDAESLYMKQHYKDDRKGDRHRRKHQISMRIGDDVALVLPTICKELGYSSVQAWLQDALEILLLRYADHLTKGEGAQDLV